jgi:hypothetical protein
MPALRFPFCTALGQLNRPRLDDFSHFILQPGMLFSAPGKWWGDGGLRPRPHEGVDLHCYLNRAGHPGRLEPGILLPALATGRIIRIAEDFLGHSIFVIHELKDDSGKILLSIYGHVDPLLSPEGEVVAGEILAAIARPRTPGVPAHLHLSMAWLPVDFPLNRLDWQTLDEASGVILLDPLLYLDCPHQT